MSEHGNRIDVALIRGFLRRALKDDAVADRVNDLLFEHVAAGRYHPSVLAETLPTYIDEVLGAARREDWEAVAGELIAEAREVDGEVWAMRAEALPGARPSSLPLRQAERGRVDENLERVGPLVDHLQRFCDAHRRGDPDAAAGMLDFVRASWPDIPETRLPPAEGDDALGEEEIFDADEVALEIIRDVGEIADFLVERGEPVVRLAWSRANLIVDLELYARVARAGPGR